MRKRVGYTLGLAVVLSGSSVIAYLARQIIGRQVDSGTTPAAKTAVQDPFYRGKPISYWSERVKNGDFHFSAWSASLTIAKNGQEEEFLPMWEEKNQEIVPLFVALLNDENPVVRQTAALGLGSYGRKDGQYTEVPALVRALEDEDEDVQWESARALARIKAQLEPKTGQLVDEILKGEKGERVLSCTVNTDEEIKDEVDSGHWNRLRYLSAWHSRVTDAGLIHLKGLTKVAYLDLQGTKITDAGLVHMRKMTNLVELNLINTAVTDAGVADLQKALPHLKVIR